MAFFAKVKRLTQAYRKFCKDRAMQFREEEIRARQEMEDAAQNLQAHLDEQSSQQCHGSARLWLQQVEDKVVNGQILRSRIRWKFRGDKVSKEFFRVVREKSLSTVITCLKDSQGTKIRDRAGLGHLCTKYYQRLCRASEGNQAH
jgi:hypothetical protein